VYNVVPALIFLATLPIQQKNEIYNVSDDDDEDNNSALMMNRVHSPVTMNTIWLSIMLLFFTFSTILVENSNTEEKNVFDRFWDKNKEKTDRGISING